MLSRLGLNMPYYEAELDALFECLSRHSPCKLEVDVKMLLALLRMARLKSQKQAVSRSRQVLVWVS